VPNAPNVIHPEVIETIFLWLWLPEQGVMTHKRMSHIGYPKIVGGPVTTDDGMAAA
jgi:hypothetical protein